MAKKQAVIEPARKFESGAKVRFNPNHPLYAGQNAIVTQDTGGGNFIVELESGDRQLVTYWHLSPQEGPASSPSQGLELASDFCDHKFEGVWQKDGTMLDRCSLCGEVQTASIKSLQSKLNSCTSARNEYITKAQTGSLAHDLQESITTLNGQINWLKEQIKRIGDLVANYRTDTEYLTLAEIAIDGGTQSRARLNDATVEEYADSIAGGAEFPPVLVFYDGKRYWLADGFHRVAAAKKALWGGFSAEIRQGTRRDAVLYSVGANATHGLRRTNADKRRAVLTLLGDEEWSRWSNREIAKTCGVSLNLVNTLRKEPSELKVQIGDDRRVSRNGKEYTMNIASIGKGSSHLTGDIPSDSCCKTEALVEPQDIVKEPLSKHKQLLPQSDRNPDVPPHGMPPMPASKVNVAAIHQGKPDAVAFEISMGMRHISPEQLAWAITNSADYGLSDDHLKAAIAAAKRVLNTRQAECEAHMEVLEEFLRGTDD